MIASISRTLAVHMYVGCTIVAARAAGDAWACSIFCSCRCCFAGAVGIVLKLLQVLFALC